jgi:hypothetical protein
MKENGVSFFGSLIILHKPDITAFVAQESPHRDLRTGRVKIREFLTVFNDKHNCSLRYFKYRRRTRRCKTTLMSNNCND